MRYPKHSLHHISARAKAGRFRLERWHRYSMYGISALLVLSGGAWLLAHYFLRAADTFGESVSPIEPWSMKLHGAAAMIALFFIGSVLNSHIRRANSARRNRGSGWTMAALLGWLTVSGYALYYLASETSRPAWSLAHSLLGLAFPLLLLLHIVLGRRSVK